MKVIPTMGFLLLLQLVFSQYNWSELDTELKAKQNLLGNNVVAIIWSKDSMLYKKEMGDFNAATVAPIASCSKWLTAALVMQFADEGKLSLDDNVSKYIPAFVKKGTGDITLRHCLSHMTGLEDDDKFLKRILARRKYASLEEEVNSFARKDIRAKAGTDFWYGNIGLNIAGRVLEVISKEKFESLIETRLFAPLGMTRSSFAGINASPVNPSGGARSTADDYMKFLLMLLNNGTYNGKRILSEKAVEEMRKVQNKMIQIKYAPKAAEGFLYAAGSWVVEYKANALGKDNISPLAPIPPGNFPDREILFATSLASPGLFGTWPMIDYCRGYAYIVFVKNFLGQERAGAHSAIKKIIDRQITPQCE